MEAKLKDSLEGKDYYSAHQLYLAIAQRHTRNKRFEEAKQVLKDGCVELAGRGEYKSSLDLAKRYLSALSSGRLPLIDVDAVNVHAVITAVGLCKDSSNNLNMEDETALKGLGETVLKEHPALALVVFHALCRCGAWKEAASVLLKLDEAKEEWSLLGSCVSDPGDVLSITLGGLKARNFAAISVFLSAVISIQFPAGKCTLETINDVDQVKVIPTGDLQGEDEVLARCLNFCQLLFVIFQSKLILTPSALTKPLQHYAGLLAKLRVKEDEIKAIEHAYLLQQHNEASGSGSGAGRPDMLANLFQSMMAGQGASPQIRRKP